MSDMDEYLARKREQLGMGRADDLRKIQSVLDTWYDGRVRAKQIHEGRLTLTTPSATIAGELRLRQVELRQAIQLPEVKLRIMIES